MKKRQMAVLLVTAVLLGASAFAATLMPERNSAVGERGPVPFRPATPVYMANGKLLVNAHEVIGRVTGASPVTVTLSGGARFWGADTYFCVAAGADNNQTLGPQVVNVDGSHFRIVHASAGTATLTYRCFGM